MSETDGAALLERAATDVIDDCATGRRYDPYPILSSAWVGTRDLVDQLYAGLESSKAADLHGCFWLLFLKRYDALAASIRGDMEHSGRANRRELQAHSRAVATWLERKVMPAIEASDEGHLFRRVTATGYLESKSAFRLFAALHRVDTDIIQEYEPLIFSVPRRIAELLGAPAR